MPPWDIFRGGQTRERALRTLVAATAASGDPGISESIAIENRTTGGLLEPAMNAYKAAPSAATGQHLRQVAGVVFGFPSESPDAYAFLALIDGGAALPAPGAPLLAPAILSRPLATFPISDVGLYLAIDANDLLKYPGSVAPANGADVAGLVGSRALLVDAVEQAGRNLPSYNNAALGAGRPGLRFDRANTECLAVNGALPGTVSTDYAGTMVAVFRLNTVPAAEESIIAHSRDASTAEHRETVRLTVLPTAFRFRAGPNFSTDTFNATVTSTPAINTTYIMIGRHGATGDTLNNLRVRVGGATLENTAGTGNVLNYSGGAAHDRYHIGARGMFGSFGQHCDLLLGECFALSRKISDAEAVTLMDALRIKHGVA